MCVCVCVGMGVKLLVGGELLELNGQTCGNTGLDLGLLLSPVSRNTV